MIAGLFVVAAGADPSVELEELAKNYIPSPTSPTSAISSIADTNTNTSSNDEAASSSSSSSSRQEQEEQQAVAPVASFASQVASFGNDFTNNVASRAGVLLSGVNENNLLVRFCFFRFGILCRCNKVLRFLAY